MRYSTAGESKLANAQPLVFKYREGDLAIATNGNLVNAPKLRSELERQGSIFQTTSDTEVMAHLDRAFEADDIVEAVKEALQQVEGAYAFLIHDEGQADRRARSARLAAVRHGPAGRCVRVRFGDMRVRCGRRGHMCATCSRAK